MILILNLTMNHYFVMQHWVLLPSKYDLSRYLPVLFAYFDFSSSRQQMELRVVTLNFW